LQILVGAGGWGLLQGGSEDRLRAYSKLFSFVEVNTTFYRIPRLATVRSWRVRTPRDFSFSVKCNRTATHVHALKPVGEVFDVLRRMLAICRILRSDMLVLQTPPNLRVDGSKVEEVSRILRNLDSGSIQAFWEVNAPMNGGSRRRLENEMLERGITPVVDLSRQDPPEGAKILYSRLFSSGGLEYTDSQIRAIHEKISRSGAEKVVLAFHGVRMYKDASRYLEFIRNMD